MRRRGLVIALLLACRPTAAPGSSAAPPTAAPTTAAPTTAAPTTATPAPVILADRDTDGIPDTDDRCPDEPEDIDHFEDTDGCVDRDNDGDKILDAHEFKTGRWTNCDYRRENGVDVDCRNLPDDFDQNEDHDGCPDLIRMDQCQLKITTPLRLDRNGRAIGDAAKILDEVAAIMLAAPDLKMSVEAHIDRQRTPTNARRITERAAQATVEALVLHGVARERLDPVARGDNRPIEPDTAAAGRARNRRVEFLLRDACGRKPAPPSPDDTPHECR